MSKETYYSVKRDLNVLEVGRLDLDNAHVFKSLLRFFSIVAQQNIDSPL
jgi:hypothetical protein